MFLCLELGQKHQYLLTQTYLYQLCHERFDAEIHINRVTFTIRFELEVKTRTSNRDWKYNCWTDNSSYRFDELFLRIVKIEHRIDQDNLYQVTYQEKTRGSTDDGQFKKLHEIFFCLLLKYCCHLGALGGPIYRHWGGPKASSKVGYSSWPVSIHGSSLLEFY